MGGRKWGSMSGLLVWWRGLLPLQLAHQILVELIFGLAGRLVADIRTFVVFERHENIVAHGPRSNHESLAAIVDGFCESLDIGCFGRAKV